MIRPQLKPEEVPPEFVQDLEVLCARYGIAIVAGCNGIALEALSEKIRYTVSACGGECILDEP